MALNFIKSQFIEVIEWSDTTKETLAYKFPIQQKEIKMGAQLTVSPTQIALFINEGRVADVFTPGRYELQTQNLPILTKLKSWQYGFNSPFKAEVYFIDTKRMLDQRWGTKQPINLRDEDFRFIAVRSNGTFSYHISDPIVFLKEVVGSGEEVTATSLIDHLRSQILASFSDCLGEAKLSYMDLMAFTDDLGRICEMKLQEKFIALGIELDSFDIQSFNLPPEVQEAINKRSTMGIMGDAVGTYTQLQAADAMTEMAKNPNGGVAGMAAQMTNGVVLGNAMSQSIATNMAKSAPQQVVEPTVPEIKSETTTPKAATKCMNCQHENPANAKFCIECGSSIQVVTPKCINCQVEITPQTKFCPECGQKQF